MSDLEDILKNNQAWAEGVKAQDSAFFTRSAQGQSPKILWIGCADSRVPPGQITGLPPGSIFVHRNIANLISHDDPNSQAVMFYAIAVLKVSHVVICGHTSCGGVAAASSDDKLPKVMDDWLTPIKAVRDQHVDILANKPAEERIDALSELSIRKQLQHLAKSEVVQQAWKDNQPLTLHGWIYSLSQGIIKPLEMMETPTGFNG